MERKTLILLMVTILSCMSDLGLCAENLSGSCGKNITWALDDDGVLTLAGHGDMPNFLAMIYFVSRKFSSF